MWRARLATGRADDDAFARWRDQSSAHAVAFARVEAAWEQIEMLPGPAAVPAMPSRRRFLRTAGLAATGSVAMGFLAARAVAWPQAETGIGERRLVALTNGSHAMLNTDTALSWSTGDQTMRIALEHGEVALQLGRPARLDGGGHRSMLSAGRFDVLLDKDRLEVTVLGGSAWMPAAGAARADPRQALLVGPDGGVTIAAAERIARALAWQTGEILLQDEPLAAAVADYNRYLHRKIVIADPALAAIRVGGRFTTTDPAPFLRGLHEGLGIRVDATSTGFVLRRG